MNQWLYLLALGLQIGFFQDPQTHFPSPVLKNCHTPKKWKICSYMMTWHRYIPLPTFPPTCGEIYLQILEQTVISTASYHLGSIKGQEMLRRSSSEKTIPAGQAFRASLQKTTPRNSYGSSCSMEW